MRSCMAPVRVERSAGLAASSRVRIRRPGSLPSSLPDRRFCPAESAGSTSFRAWAQGSFRTAWEEDAFPLARRLMREEGLFVGMSSGAIAWVALNVAAELGPGARVAMIAPDSAARYLSTSLFG